MNIVTSSLTARMLFFHVATFFAASLIVPHLHSVLADTVACANSKSPRSHPFDRRKPRRTPIGEALVESAHGLPSAGGLHPLEGDINPESGSELQEVQREPLQSFAAQRAARRRGELDGSDTQLPQVGRDPCLAPGDVHEFDERSLGDLFSAATWAGCEA